jgi:hypothetical protein
MLKPWLIAQIADATREARLFRRIGKKRGRVTMAGSIERASKPFATVTSTRASPLAFFESLFRPSSREAEKLKPYSMTNATVSAKDWKNATKPQADGPRVLVRYGMVMSGIK